MSRNYNYPWRRVKDIAAHFDITEALAKEIYDALVEQYLDAYAEGYEDGMDYA